MRERDTSRIAFARGLRGDMTPPEVRIWVRLRDRIEDEIAFRRQVPFKGYILDFYCAKAKLAVEVDGMIHNDPEQAAHDQRRDLILSEHGVLTYRMTGADIMADLDEAAWGTRMMARARMAELKKAKQRRR